MSLKTTLSVLAALTMTAFGLVAAQAAPSGEAMAVDPQPTPIVLELFTSQGCSSCPPADRLLRELAGSEELAGRIVPLSFHVDYWNYIGWEDPFSSADWTQRQQAYAHTVFQTRRIYTPQVVIQGAADCVGSRESCLRREIEAAAQRADATRIDLQGALLPSNTVSVTVRAQRPAAAPDGLELMVALFESGLSTPIDAGENARRTLENDYVVRRLVRAGRVAQGEDEAKPRELELPVKASWEGENLGLAAFLQDPVTLKIWGAAVLHDLSPAATSR